jgi:aminoglycoside/choline kinase family phosphotransferase
MKEIPQNISHITREWFNDVLLPSDIFDRTCVTAVESESLGPGAGYIGQLYRLNLDYDKLSDTAPKKIIAKLSSADPEVRASLHQSGVYETEVRFYQELAAQAGIPTPRCYFADIDNETGYSLLLLEDLGHYRGINFSNGCTLSEAQLVVDKLAQFHAKWWLNDQLKPKKYLKPHDHNAQYWQEGFQQWWPKLATNIHNLVPEVDIPSDFIKLGDRLAPFLSQAFAQMSMGPITLVHKDTHSNNLFFGRQPDDKPLVVIDWQMAGYGKGIADVTHFIVASLPVEHRRKYERYLIAEYHKTLQAHGVSDYSLPQCWADYEQSYFKNMHVLALLVSFLDTTSAQGKQLLRDLVPRVVSFSQDHQLDKYLP